MAYRVVVTALNQYDQLESLELWRDAPDAQRREVVVSLGRTALLVKDLNDNVHAHWDLYAINRLNPNQFPAVYSPGATESETIEITDPHMIEAIDVFHSISHKPARISRVRRKLMSVCVGAVIATGAYLGMTLLPDALEEQAVQVTPNVRIQAIDDKLLAEIATVSGPECDLQATTAVLARLMNAIALDASVKVSFVELGERRSVHLPGGRILLDHSLLDPDGDPELAASFVLMEFAAGRDRHLFRDLIRFAGSWHTMAFLLGRDIPTGVLQDFVPVVLAQEPSPRSLEHLLALFSNARLSSYPLAEAIGRDSPLGEALAGAGETGAQGSGDGLIVDMADWNSLRNACTR